MSEHIMGWLLYQKKKNNNITLYCEGTPNPFKISIALEELGLEYNVRPVKLFEHEQNE